jgi:sensor histidine kinase YesM
LSPGAAGKSSGVIGSVVSFMSTPSRRDRFCEPYRFEERLHVVLDIPVQVRDIQIPSLIVQPLVENAIKHGIGGARSGGVIAVTATVEDTHERSELLIRVRNTGAPLTGSSANTGSGVGLRNVEQRLRHYYNGEASLRLFSDPGGATIAELRLPTAAREQRFPLTKRRGTW